MSWVTIIWSMVASACLTLAAIHLLVWWERRTAWAYLLISLTSAATAVLAGCELWMMRAETPGQFATAVRWLHIPAFVITLSLVGFVRLHLRSGRPWLGWSVCAVRTLALLLNFLVGQNLNYREVTALRHNLFLGEAVSTGVGAPNPCMLVGQLGLVLFVIFSADAAITVWRRGDRRLALVTGGGIVFFAMAGSLQATLALWQVMDWPVAVSFFYLSIVVAMGYELSRDTLRAAQLADDLGESEERMALAAEEAGIGVWVWTTDQKLLWGSERWRRMFGFAPDEAVSYEMVLQRIHPDDRAFVEQKILGVLAGGHDYSVEYRVVQPDGNQRWVAARGRMHPEGNGKPARILGVSFDITARKWSDKVLKESEARFRAVADTAPVLIWMSGTDKLCSFFNQGWLEFTGRKLEQELGNGWAEGVHPEDLPRCLKTYRKAFDARRTFTMEYRLRRHDGEYRWITDHGVPRFDSGGEFLGYIGSCVDYTERKLSEERFRLVVEASPSGIMLVNGQGRITLVNALAERLFGYPRAELLGQTVDLLVPERWRAEYRGQHDNFREAPGAQMMGTGRELFGRRKDGTEFPLEIGLSPIQGPEGNEVLAVIVDITARKEAETEAMRQRDQLVHVARVSTMGQLASSLAHELNQPLGAIVRNAEAAELLLLEPSPDLEEVRAILADIRKDDQRAGDVIDRMRTLMRRGEVQRHLLNLKLLAGEVITLARPDAYTRRVRLALEADPGLPPVQGDRVQLQQVVLNLVLNAMDAQRDNPPAGRLVVVRARPAGATVEVAVSDHGHGIPADQLSRIFEPFFTSKPGGLGMGLAISRSIVEAHGGRLWAENNPGGGATFRFTLPTGYEVGPRGGNNGSNHL